MEPGLVFDKLEYAVGDVVSITSEIPIEEEFVIINIFSDIASLKNYKLRRISANLYQGQVRLTKPDSSPEGEGPYDGKLPVEYGGDIYAVLQHEGKDIKFEALVVAILSEIIFDKDDYTPLDEMIVSIISPDSNMDPDIIENLRVTVRTSSSTPKIFDFSETGTNTGIFERDIRLTPDPARFKGDLIVQRGDGITVTFKSQPDTIAEKSVTVNYHHGIVMFHKDAYNLTDNCIIRVIDPDENRDPNAIDKVTVRVWSSSDKTGLELELRESGDRTGIFEGAIGFDTEKTSGNKLRASIGDTITVKYVDKTLPLPAKMKADMIETVETEELFAIALIGIKPPTPKAVLPQLIEGPGFIIVEGEHDESFLRNVLQAIVGDINLKALGYDIIRRSKDKQNDFIVSLANTGKWIIAFRDIDDKFNLEEEINKCSDLIQRTTKLTNKIDGGVIKTSSGSDIKIIGMGLRGDPDLATVHVAHHAAEDYLLKLLAIDPNVKEWAGIELQELRRHAEPLKDLGVGLTKSKTLFVTLAVIKKSNYEECMTQLLYSAKLDNVILVAREVIKHFIPAYF